MTVKLLMSMMSMMSMVYVVYVVSMFLTKAAVLTVEDTAGVTQSSLAASGLVNALILVRLGAELTGGEAQG